MKFIRYFLIVFLVTQFSTSRAQNGKKLHVGDKAPEITMANMTGDKISLSDLQGKIVLIDFWASWCRPCRKDHPQLVKVYKKFKNARFSGGEEGFVVYSISIDKDRGSWLKTIEQDNLLWTTHFFSEDGWDSPVVKKYGVNVIPKSFLINGKGEIIKIDPGLELESILSSLRN